MTDIIKNKTACRKIAVLFTPVVWMCVFSAAAKILPSSPFANGLDTFCMNGGMIVWLAYLCVAVPRGNKK